MLPYLSGACGQRAVSAVLLLAYLPACTTMHTGEPTPSEFVAREHPKSIRITRTDSTTLWMRQPVVQNDSLIGLVKEDRQKDSVDVGGVKRPARSDTLAPASVALADVRSVAAERVSPGRTILVVAAGVVVVLAVAAWIECSGKSGWEAIGCP